MFKGFSPERDYASDRPPVPAKADNMPSVDSFYALQPKGVPCRSKSHKNTVRRSPDERGKLTI